MSRIDHVWPLEFYHSGSTATPQFIQVNSRGQGQHFWNSWPFLPAFNLMPAARWWGAKSGKRRRAKSASPVAWTLDSYSCTVITLPGCYQTAWHDMTSPSWQSGHQYSLVINTVLVIMTVWRLVKCKQCHNNSLFDNCVWCLPSNTVSVVPQW